MKSRLPEEWKEVKMSEITEKIGSGSTPRGGSKVYIDDGVSFIRSQNVLDFIFSKDGLVNIDEDAAKKLNNVEVMPNDILINITGDSVARSCLVPNNVLPARVNQHVSIIRAKESISYHKYIFYKLQHLKAQLLSYASSGATRNALTKSMLESLTFNIPPLKEQKAIADTLSSLDNKIETNNKINKNLEQQAQEIFKHWFVDFEFPDENGNPYKSSGGAMVESELGMIPEGWEVIKLGDKFDFVKGKVPKYTDKSDDNSYPYLSKSVIDGNWSDVKYGLKGTGVKCEPLDVLMMMDGSSSSNVFYGHSGLISSTLSLIDANDENIREILFLYFNIFNEDIKNQNTGSAIPHANKNYINSIEIAVPISTNILEDIASVFKLFRIKTLENKKQSQILSQLRDTLLPKLMSGEIRIPLD